MRKPVSPGELMQLQTPAVRTPCRSTRREGNGNATATSSANSNAPAAPRTALDSPPQPASRARPAGMDDSLAKTRALRSKSPQKQRQNGSNIIGEND